MKMAKRLTLMSMTMGAVNWLCETAFLDGMTIRKMPARIWISSNDMQVLNDVILYSHNINRFIFNDFRI